MVYVSQVKHLRDYVLWLRFSDGVEGEIDLADDLHGQMFAPLLDPEQFASARVDPELDTVVWDNGADLAPEYLYERVRVTV